MTVQLIAWREIVPETHYRATYRDLELEVRRQEGDGIFSLKTTVVDPAFHAVVRQFISDTPGMAQVAAGAYADGYRDGRLACDLQPGPDHSQALADALADLLPAAIPFLAPARSYQARTALDRYLRETKVASEPEPEEPGPSISLPTVDQALVRNEWTDARIEQRPDSVSRSVPNALVQYRVTTEKSRGGEHYHTGWCATEAGAWKAARKRLGKDGMPNG